MIDIKIHPNEVVSLCDSELIGKCFEDDELQLDVSERFYKGQNLDEEEVIKIMKDADNLNIVGEESVALGIKAKVINEENIIKIKGIPHAQVFAL